MEPQDQHPVFILVVAVVVNMMLRLPQHPVLVVQVVVVLEQFLATLELQEQQIQVVVEEEDTKMVDPEL